VGIGGHLPPRFCIVKIHMFLLISCMYFVGEIFILVLLELNYGVHGFQLIK